MRYSPFSALPGFLAALLFCLCLVTAANSLAVGMVSIQCPDEAGIGQPLPVTISSRYPLDNLTVTWRGKTLKPQVDGERYDYRSTVILGTDLHAEPGEGVLTVSATLWGHYREFSKTLPIVPVEYQSETLSVPPKMVTPPQEVLDRIAHERSLTQEALATKSGERYWSLPFTRPVKGKLLSRFGLYRVFNGEAKRRHTGLDFRAWEGTPLLAMAPGKIILTGHFYYAGNCAFIDHGNGLISLYCHMSKLKVKQGDFVQAGQAVGLSGATGRVTGAHLHLAVFAMGEVIDPEPFFTGKLDLKQ